MLSIGALSKRTGVKIPTIRYYEQIGLMAATERTESNQRRYCPEGLRRLSFIRHSRDLGFSIEDIRSLIELSQHPQTKCGDAHTIALQHLEDVRSRIAKLKRLECELKRISQCKADYIADCALIETLADHSLCETDH